LIPVTLTLEGFLSYKEMVTVDMSQIRVACVSGSNGAGKSTLFDAITWALFGRARRSDDGLIHTKSDSCQVVFEFEYEGNRYRVDRIKPRGKSTTLEFHVQGPDGTWKPFTEAGMRATEQRVQDILGLDYDTFVNASFFLQGKADMFSVQSPGKRKEILSNILGLTVWDTYRDVAATHRKDAQKQLEVQQSILQEVVSELDEEDARKERLAHAKELLEMKAKLREGKEKLLETAQMEKSQIRNDLEKLDMLSKQVHEIEADIFAISERLQKRETEIVEYGAILSQETDIVSAHQEYLVVREQLTELNSVSAQFHTLLLQKKELEAKISSEKARLEQEHKNLLERQAEVASLKHQQQQIKEDAQKKQTESAELQAEIEKTDALEKEQAAKKDLQSEKEGENKQLRIKMDEIKDRMAHLEKSSGPDCPLCGQPLDASHKKSMLAELAKDGTDLGDRHRKNQETISACKEAINALTEEIKRLRSLRPQLTNALAQVNTLTQRLEESQKKIIKWEREDAKRLEAVDECLRTGQFSVQIQPKLDALSQEISALDYSPEEHEKLREQELTLRVFEEKLRKLEQARTARGGLKREITDLEKQLARLRKNQEQLNQSIATLSDLIKQKNIKAADPDLLEQELLAVRQEENKARQDVGIAQQEVNVLDKLRARKAEIENITQQISRQIARLKMLETAFGKDGVPALLIENAIPQIETQANEILDKLSGGSMSVSFETEREYADKKREDRKQTLDIIIRDSAGSRAYELFSGGEAFRINFAIRLALSRVLAQRSGARLQTLVIDEGFGSQDAEGRQRLVEAINLVRADFEKILVITHLDELKDAFSSRIEVTKSPQGSRVEVIV